MGDDSDITSEVRERLQEDSEVHADSDGDSDPLFTTDSGADTAASEGGSDE